MNHSLHLTPGFKAQMGMGILYPAATIEVVKSGIWNVVPQVQGEEVRKTNQAQVILKVKREVTITRSTRPGIEEIQG